MTKQIRIENADTNNAVKVVVELWERGPGNVPDRLVDSRDLAYPTSMTELFLTADRYLKVRELPV